MERIIGKMDKNKILQIHLPDFQMGVSSMDLKKGLKTSKHHPLFLLFLLHSTFLVRDSGFHVDSMLEKSRLHIYDNMYCYFVISCFIQIS